MTREDQAIEALYAMVQQHCRGAWPADEGSEHYGTNCLSTHADALLVLCGLGVLKQVGEAVGRAVEAKDTEPAWSPKT